MASKKKNGFSLAYLKQLLSQDPEMISEQFLNCLRDPQNKLKFQNILKSNLEPDDLITVLSLVTKIPWPVLESAKINILGLISSNELFDTIVKFLVNTVHNDYFNKDDFFVLVQFFEIIITCIPICGDVYQKFLTLFEMSYNFLESFILYSPIELQLYERIEELVRLLMYKAYYIERNKWHYSYMNMYPSPVDFFENRSLVPNIIKGSYDSADQYLDTHFKILKEDFICSVREGIDQLRSEAAGAKEKKNSSIYFYKNVLSTGISTDKGNFKSKIYHTILLSDEDKTNMSLDNVQMAKRFMSGSLLFFTRNNFTTFIVATVEDTGDKNDRADRILRGIKVSVIGNPYLLRTGVHYHMCEPVTFFEPYYQSLKTLQSLDPNNFPLIKNIVFADMKPVSSELKFTLGDNYTLNPSQQAALEAALSQKFSIIQGPPGTGKSHLARAIISTLVQSGNCDNFPILVVCVRNNALDLVLEPLVSTGTNIIRLGRQSKSEILTELTLPKMRREYAVTCSSRHLLFTKIKQFRDIILDPSNENCPEAIETAVNGYTTASESLNCLLQYYDAKQLMSNGVHVIGATTAGAARYHNLLSYIKPKVVIIEEAAEVMESIIVTSIPEGCDHVILIGDHLQLQPTPAWHRSSVKYNMNISLFERMIENGMEYHQLNEQHRMRPEIAQLISPLIYKDLLNHPSVCMYPDVKGIAKNVFFLNHNIKENAIVDDSESHWNRFEADFLLALAQYLVKQDYYPSQISILATYAAQHSYIKKACETSIVYSDLAGIQSQVVDNYQGEENDIILLSLVRSRTPTVGFLSNMNRINVALSRAKHGLFIIGNMNTLSNCYEGWKKITSILKSQQAIGNTLPLQCKNHKTITEVSKPEQISSLKLGGCDLACQFILDCGHICPYPCHGSTKLHELDCEEMCNRLRACGHKCKKRCFEDCNSTPCIRKNKFTLICGHKVWADCPFDFRGFQCHEPCKKLLPCNRHPCQHLCYTECGPLPCKLIVEKKFPCGHTKHLPCSDIASYRCKERCSKMASCGIHKCQKLCNEKCGGPCLVLVQTELNCGHITTLTCSYDKNNPLTWGREGIYRCSVLVRSMSEQCSHPFFQPCHEKTDCVKYTGQCLLGCAQNQDNLCLII